MSILESLSKILDSMENKGTVKEDVEVKVDAPVAANTTTTPDQDKVTDADLRKLLIADKDKNVLNEDDVIEEGKKDPKAEVRNKPNPVFDANSPKVTDDKDHYPISSANQARNAWARANQYNEKNKPTWYKGTITQLKSAVKKAVKKAYPSIELKD